MSEQFKTRQKELSSILADEGIFAAVLRDFEGHRNQSVRYLTGHPQDALLFVFNTGETVLLPWDMIMAEKHSTCSEIIPYTDFNRNYIDAVKAVLEKKAVSTVLTGTEGMKVEFPSASAWPEIETLRKTLPGMEIVCRHDGIDRIINSLRIIKDEMELGTIREAASLTDRIIDEIEDFIRTCLKKGKHITETDIAFMIEKRAREKGAEGTGFETLVASQDRSWAIHPFPAFSGAEITGKGFTIIDFGIRLSGYTTDVTLTIAGENLTAKQKQMAEAVAEAAATAEKILKPGISSSLPAAVINSFFRERGYTMPHSLGHGIGLDVHESPLLREVQENPEILKPGMVLAVEPGLYDIEAGGVRLENDFLITENSCERITSSRIIQYRCC